jgi:hypothetical protein
MTIPELERAGVESRDRVRWITSQMQEAAAKAGPPASLIAAVGRARGLTVISPGQLSVVWQQEGMTDDRLHPQAVAKVADLFGVSTDWSLVADSKRQRWPAELVVANAHLERIHAAATALHRRLREDRLLTLTDAQSCVPELSDGELGRLVEGCEWLAADGEHVVDPNPRGVDHGMGRAFASVEGRPLRLEILQTALRRWTYDSKSRDYDWDAVQLERYLHLSPLYAAAGDGWVPVGDWPRMSQLDRTVVAVMDRAATDVTLPGLVALLTPEGLTVGAAEHVAAISPVLRRTGRGRYALLA